MIYAVRVTSGQEKILAEMLAKKGKAEKLSVYSVVYVENVKGYLFVEAEEENTIAKLLQKVKHVKGFIKKSMSGVELENLLKTSLQPAAIIEVGDVVEMVSGPFKGERAKVVKVDEAKDETTVELVEVAVPIPVTVKSKIVRLFQKAGQAEQSN